MPVLPRIGQVPAAVVGQDAEALPAVRGRWPCRARRGRGADRESGASTGGSNSRLSTVVRVGARTVSVGGCQSVASSSVESRNRRCVATSTGRACSRMRWRGRSQARRAEVPKAPAISASFARASAAAAGGPETITRICASKSSRPSLSLAACRSSSRSWRRLPDVCRGSSWAWDASGRPSGPRSQPRAERGRRRDRARRTIQVGEPVMVCGRRGVASRRRHRSARMRVAGAAGRTTISMRR